jgi:translation initiation factor IF-3
VASLQVLDRFSIRNFPKVRLVGKDSNEVITGMEALERANDDGLDLVLVNPDVVPPVVRIKDQKKEEYEKKKSRKPTKKIENKEIRFQTNISDHDLATKLKAIEKFLEKGNKVKISVRLKGRERENPQRAHDIIERVISSVQCKASRVPGPIAMAVLEPATSK